ncbi:MAG: hypothetical protein AMXMBFR57_34860 [Acidimicrobiia bacterium]
MTGVTVVIPTLAGPSLAETLTRVNAGTVRPDEILVCVPEREAPRAHPLGGGNVRVLVTTCRGQVAQRAEGFKAARTPFVMQLDDDIWPDAECLAKLIDYAERHPGTAVGPALHDRVTGQYRSYLVPSDGSLLERILFRVINGTKGFQPGQISLAGVNMGLPAGRDFHGVGWLPGGCVLHRREALDLSAFYPFPGKAFAEDLFHSRLLTRAGVVLARCGAATCSVDFSSSGGGGVRRALRDYLTYGRRMRVFTGLVGGSQIRLHTFLGLNVLRLISRRAA